MVPFLFHYCDPSGFMLETVTAKEGLTSASVNEVPIID